MTGTDLLRRMTERLTRAGVPYMLTGSFAGSYHGIPRATQDIDLVIAPTATQLRILLAHLPAAEYYVDTDAAVDAMRREAQFNVIDLDSGWKVDLIIRKSRPFSREEFERREAVTFEGMPLTVTSVEDLMIAKLEWARLADSQRQIADVAGLLKVASSRLDQAYLTKWVGSLDLRSQWDAARRLAALPRDRT